MNELITSEQLEILKKVYKFALDNCQIAHYIGKMDDKNANHLVRIGYLHKPRELKLEYKLYENYGLFYLTEKAINLLKDLK